MDESLLRNIQAVIGKMEDCYFIPAERGEKLIQNVAEKFSLDIRQLFLWDNKNYSEIFDYSTSDQWEPILRKLLARFNDRIFLVVSNEGLFPWKVLNFKASDCISLLTELPFFEYFLFDESMKNIIFDTHHNSLILFKQDTL